ncbi:AB-hydrolase YheT [Panus rudis PR-1116 ss-1]|nr:AB-hydrolase YheT [Panus rudis PR-1116 ss-1]
MASSSVLAVVLVVLAGWVVARTRARSTPCDLYCASHNDVIGKNQFNLANLVRQKVPALSTGFSGVWWLPGGNAQTLYTAMGDFTHIDPVVYERRLLQTADGGIIAVDISPPIHSHPIQPNETVVVIAHGLTGGSHEHYVRSMVKKLTPAKEEGGLGARIVVSNYRGCNGSPVITPRLYNAGSSDDLRVVILWASQTFPNSTLLGLGFSLGANIMTKYTGEEGPACPLTAVVSLANVWDFYKGGQFGNTGTYENKYFYRYILGGALRSLLFMHKKVFLEHPDSKITKEVLDELSRKRKLRLLEYDNIVQTRMFGFKDAWDYYKKISSLNVLDKIEVPLLGINALDDPIIGWKVLPYAQVRRNPWVVLATTSGGGHMGWFEQGPDGSISRWESKPTVQFFRAIMEVKDQFPPRPRPKTIVNSQGFVQQEGSPDVAYREVTPESIGPVVSGDGESKLFSGW